MRRFVSRLGAGLVFLHVWIPRTSGQQAFAAPDRSLHHARDHILVKFRDTGVTRSIPAGRLGQAATLDQLGVPAQSLFVDRIYGAGARSPHLMQGGAPVATLARRCVYLCPPPKMTVEELADRLKGNPNVEYAELDGIQTAGAQVIPNDRNFPDQWHLLNTNYNGAVRCDIHAPEAWGITRGKTNVVVAVLDTGCNPNLLEFLGRLVSGTNIADGNGSTFDNNGHGTIVSSIIGAKTSNSIFVAGVDWNCKIMPVKIFDSNMNGLESWIASGIYYAVSNGAKVINYSGGGPTFSQTMADAIDFAVSNQVIFVTITHNDATNSIRFPGSYSNSITVGSTDPWDQWCPHSNYGPEIDLSAPGTNMVVLNDWGNVVTNAWGSSFAAPQVSGACALMAALRPSLDQAQVRQILCASADDVGTTGFDVHTGWGRLNVYQALLLTKGFIRRPAVIPWLRRINFSVVSPANAETRQPFCIERSTSLAGPWLRISDADVNIHYPQPGEEEIKDPGEEIGGPQTGFSVPLGEDRMSFYRVAVTNR